MVARANQKAALEPVNAVLKGKPHVFESWSETQYILHVTKGIVTSVMNMKFYKLIIKNFRY
jgi:hypothetical protein